MLSPGIGIPLMCVKPLGKQLPIDKRERISP
jgi:hypothetical protein